MSFLVTPEKLQKQREQQRRAQERAAAKQKYIWKAAARDVADSRFRQVGLRWDWRGRPAPRNQSKNAVFENPTKFSTKFSN